MKPTDINIIILLFTFCATVVPFTVTTLYHKNKPIFKQPHDKGYLFVIFTATAFAFTVIKDKANDSIDAKTKVITDSIAKIAQQNLLQAVDDSKNSTIRTFTGRLAEYGLRYDSASNSIMRKLDSTKQVSNNFFGTEPDLFVKQIKETSSGKGDSLNVDIIFKSNNQSASHTYANLYVVSESTSGKYYIEGIYRFITDAYFPKEEPQQMDLELPKFGNLPKAYFVFNGYYEDGKKVKYPFKTVNFFDRKLKSTGTLIEEKRRPIIEFLIAKGITF